MSDAGTPKAPPTSKQLAALSQWIDSSYAPGIDPELAMRRRTGKFGVEYMEVQDAIEGWTGENPRKGKYATKEDVLKELLDVAATALCAYEHLTGNQGHALLEFIARVDVTYCRAGLAVDHDRMTQPKPFNPDARKRGLTMKADERVDVNEVGLTGWECADSRGSNIASHDRQGRKGPVKITSGSAGTPKPDRDCPECAAPLCEHARTSQERPALIAEVERLQREVRSLDNIARDANRVTIAAMNERDELRAQRQAALDLHRPILEGETAWCGECCMTFPCHTVAALGVTE